MYKQHYLFRIMIDYLPLKISYQLLKVSLKNLFKQRGRSVFSPQLAARWHCSALLDAEIQAGRCSQTQKPLTHQSKKLLHTAAPLHTKAQTQPLSSFVLSPTSSYSTAYPPWQNKTFLAPLSRLSPSLSNPFQICRLSQPLPLSL